MTTSTILDDSGTLLKRSHNSDIFENPSDEFRSVTIDLGWETSKLLFFAFNLLLSYYIVAFNLLLSCYIVAFFAFNLLLSCYFIDKTVFNWVSEIHYSCSIKQHCLLVCGWCMSRLIWVTFICNSRWQCAYCVIMPWVCVNCSWVDFGGLSNWIS